MTTKLAINFHLQCISISATSGRSRGVPGAPPPPPSDQIFLDFMQFSGNLNKIVSWHHPEDWRPSPHHENPGSATGNKSARVIPSENEFFTSFVMIDFSTSKQTQKEYNPPPQKKTTTKQQQTSNTIP